MEDSRIIASHLISTGLIDSTTYRFKGEDLGPGRTLRAPHPSHLLVAEPIRSVEIKYESILIH